LIFNFTTTMLRTRLNGMDTLLRCGSKSNCAYAVVKKKQFKYNSHNKNRCVFLQNITQKLSIYNLFGDGCCANA
jgi:hypothetical protein